MADLNLYTRMKQSLAFTTERYKKKIEDFELIYYFCEYIIFEVGLHVPNSLACVFNSFQHISSAFSHLKRNQQFFRGANPKFFSLAMKDFFYSTTAMRNFC